MFTIGYDAKRAFNNDSGLGNYSRLLIESMLAAYPENAYHLYTPRISADFEGWARQIGKQGAFVELPPKRLQRLFKSYWRTVSLGRQLPSKKIQLYHGLSHELPFGLTSAKIKSVVTIHDLIFLRYPEYYPRVDRFFYERKIKQACHQADAIVAISEQTANDLVKLLKVDAAKVEVIYQDCDPLFKQSTGELQAAAPSSPYIFVAGSFEKRKNHLKILEAFAQLPEDRPRLLFAGKKSSYLNEMMSLAKKLGISQEIEVKGFVSKEELPTIYRNALFTVYLSEFEGFGLPVLESMSCGTPVLTANGSSLPEVGGDAALYANANDLDGIVMQMRRLLYDEELRAAAQNASLKQAAEFSHEKAAKQLYQLYTKLL